MKLRQFMEGQRKKREKRQQMKARHSSPRLVRLYDAMPGTVAALMVAERGHYTREPYRFD